MGVDAGGAEQSLRVAGAEGLHGCAVLYIGSGEDHLADAGRPGAFEHLVAIPVKGGVEQIDADIDPFHRSAAACRWLAAGTRFAGKVLTRRTRAARTLDFTGWQWPLADLQGN